MPPVSRFGDGGKAKKKQIVIDKLKTFFEKYSGVGGAESFTELESEELSYDSATQSNLLMVAENSPQFGSDN